MRLRSTSVVFLVLAILVSLFGMQSTASVWPLGPVPRELALTQTDNGRLLELGQSQLLTVRLECNPSTGYRWDVQQMDRGVLRQVGEAEFVAQSGLLGAPATQVLRFAGISRGRTRLQLIYQRPWESDVPPARTFSVQVQSQGLFVGTDNSGPPPSADRLPAAEVSTAAALPAYFDWCAQGGCTSVKNQGSCGSCWAFSTVGSFESAIKLQDAVEKNLSEQYLVSCNQSGWSCSGGWFAHDYHVWRIPSGESQAGARYEADFPYTATNAPCNPPHPAYEKLNDWFYVTNSYSVPSVDQIKQAIYDHGPVSAALCVNSAFQSYHSGVFTGPSCGDINHAIVLAGWDDSKGAWLLKNSWGSGWGEGGYMWIGYGVSYVGYAANYVLYGGGQNQPPVANFTYDCTGLSCNFSASGSSDPDGSITNYAWSFGDGGTGSDVATSHSYGSAGTYTVVLTVTDNDSATDTDAQNVTVSGESPKMHVGDLDGSSSISNKNFWRATVTISVHDVDNNPVPNATVNGTWSGGASGSSSCLTDAAGLCNVTSPQTSQAQPSLTLAVDSVTHATMTYDPSANHDPDGDSYGTSITVMLGGTNQPPVATYTCACTDLSCDFDASASEDPDGSITDWNWDFGDGYTGIGETTSHTYGGPGTYTVLLEVTDNDGAKDTDTQDVPVDGSPRTMFVFAIDMAGKVAGPNRSATAVVTIYEVGHIPVAGATVHGFWSGDYTATVSGVTGSDGTLSFTSGRVRHAGAYFVFEVSDVVKSAYIFDPSLGPKSNHITVP